MRTRFDQQLETLHVELIRMGALCEDAIDAAFRALLQQNEALVKAAEEAEQELDRREREVEHLCMKLLLQQQPVAGDLRRISAAMKMISDLERIGDQAADIAELAREITLPEEHSLHIAAMAEAVGRMVKDSVESFVRDDLELAQQVCRSDDWVDVAFEQVRDELIALIAENAGFGREGLNLLMVAKYLERIGDHATNVAEWVEYSITGVHPTEET